MQGTGALIAVPGASVWGHPEQHEAHREGHNFGVTKALQEPLVHLVIPLITGVLHFFGLVAVPVPEEAGELRTRVGGNPQQHEAGRVVLDSPMILDMVVVKTLIHLVTLLAAADILQVSGLHKGLICQHYIETLAH